MSKKKKKNANQKNDTLNNTRNISTEELSATPKETKEVKPVTPKESATPPLTQEFVAVSAKNEAPLYELVRTSSVGYAGACRKLSWFSLRNTHWVVYTMFFLVLTVFSLYYGLYNFDKMLCIFAGVAACFMLYVTLRGHKLFLEGMAFDEERRDGTLNCSFYSDKLVLTDSTESHTVQYSSVSQLRVVKHYVYIRVKNNKALRNGILLEKPIDNKVLEGILNTVNNR